MGVRRKRQMFAWMVAIRGECPLTGLRFWEGVTCEGAAIRVLAAGKVPNSAKGLSGIAP
jgi:hypothetical protein